MGSVPGEAAAVAVDEALTGTRWKAEIEGRKWYMQTWGINIWPHRITLQG